MKGYIILSFHFCNRFLGCNLRVLPVHNTSDVVKGMLVIAEVSFDVFFVRFKLIGCFSGGYVPQIHLFDIEKIV